MDLNKKLNEKKLDKVSGGNTSDSDKSFLNWASGAVDEIINYYNSPSNSFLNASAEDIMENFKNRLNNVEDKDNETYKKIVEKLNNHEENKKKLLHINVR